MLAECLQLFDQAIAGVVEIFVDSLQAFGGDGFHADESTLDVGFAHCIEKLGVFGGFHGDLGEENHVFGKLGQLGHQAKALIANILQLLDLRVVLLRFG